MKYKEEKQKGRTSIFRKRGSGLRRDFLLAGFMLLGLSLSACQKADPGELSSETTITAQATEAKTKEQMTTEASNTEATEEPTVLQTEEITSTEIVTEEPTEAFEAELHAEYIGPTKYVGQNVAPGELNITVIWSDGKTEVNPSGWGTDIWKLLEAGENTYPIIYHDLTTTVTIPAEDGMEGGFTACKENTASDASFDGQTALKEALNYLNFSINNYGALTPVEGHAGMAAAFVRLIYQGFGFALPYEPERQMTYGTEISRDELRVGDLVFVRTKAEGSSEELILPGLYVGGDWILSCAEDGHADFYWCDPVACRRLFENTSEINTEECFRVVINAFKKQGEYGKWVASFIDDVPMIIGRIRRFTFVVNLLQYEDGYYRTYFSYDEFLLPESFVKQWQKQYLNKNALCEVMRNGEYVRYDQDGNEFFKIQVTPEVWAKLTPGLHGEYWNLDFGQ